MVVIPFPIEGLFTAPIPPRLGALVFLILLPVRHLHWRCRPGDFTHEHVPRADHTPSPADGMNLTLSCFSPHLLTTTFPRPPFFLPPYKICPDPPLLPSSSHSFSRAGIRSFISGFLFCIFFLFFFFFFFFLLFAFPVAYHTPTLSPRSLRL